MKTEKVNVTYYRMHYNDIIGNTFTKYAREKMYFRDEKDNKVYYLSDGKKIIVPISISKELFSKCMISLYPIGSIISDKKCGACGEVIYYIMESNKYVIKNSIGSTLSIHFDNAIVQDTYYFISSSGKIQKDIVGRDTMVEQFRKNTNNYFENKEEAYKKLNEMLAYFK